MPSKRWNNQFFHCFVYYSSWHFTASVTSNLTSRNWLNEFEMRPAYLRYILCSPPLMYYLPVHCWSTLWYAIHSCVNESVGHMWRLHVCRAWLSGICRLCVYQRGINAGSSREPKEMLQRLFVLSALYGDVIAGKCFPYYWTFVSGIHRWPVDSPHKGPVIRILMLLCC